MANQAKGSFDVQTTQNAPRSLGDGLSVGHMTFHKQFSGDLVGTSVVEMLGMMFREIGSGAYVALERVACVLHGKTGTFCLQHSSSMTRGRPAQAIAVVPDSGTSELEGIGGTFTIDIVDGQHFYSFDYSIDGK